MTLGLNRQTNIIRTVRGLSIAQITLYNVEEFKTR